jgi:hypothetical protein
MDVGGAFQLLKGVPPDVPPKLVGVVQERVVSALWYEQMIFELFGCQGPRSRARLELDASLLAGGLAGVDCVKSGTVGLHG